MSWWNIIKQGQTLDVGLSNPTSLKEGEEYSKRLNSPSFRHLRQRVPETDFRYKEGQQTLNQNTPTQTVQDAATTTALESQAQELEQQQLSDDAASDVGEVISRIKQQLARPPQGAKGVRALPIVEKLITATQTPTDFRDSVKEVVRELKLLEPTAV